MTSSLLSTATGLRLSLFAAAVSLLSGCNGTAAGVADPVEKVAPGVAFLKDCKKWNENSSGALQGLDDKRRDSATNLCFSTYYGVDSSYEIIFVHKGSVEQRRQMAGDSVNRAFLRGCDGLFADFECYAFVHPMKDPQKMADMHDDNNVYPCRVRAFKRVKDDEWTLVREKWVTKFEELAMLEFRTIYGR